MSPEHGELDEVAPHQASGRLSLSLFAGVVGAALGLMIVLLALDVSLSELTVHGIAGGVQAGGLSEALGSLAEVLAAVLGLSLTVVAIVVQLASQRYSAKIVDLFMRDWTNVGVFSFMVVSCIYVVLLPAFAGPEQALPDITVGAGLVLAVVNFGLLLPYFGHVFAFLHPNNIITQIKTTAYRSLGRAHLGRGELSAAQIQMAQAIERIADNCLAAITQSDRSLALHSIRTMEELILRYFRFKVDLPPSWSKAPHRHFFALSEEFYEEIVHRGTWVEAKTLMEFEHVMRRALGSMSELVSQLSSSSRAIGERALEEQDGEALELVLRFFNTYIRHALNARNVRAVYNILYQYRQLSVTAMSRRPDLSRRVVEHLVYYGRIANAMGLPFVTVTAAHDVRVMCEHAFAEAHIDVIPVLELFLTLDQPSEGKTEELALLGVRKAQSILGAFFLSRGAPELAQRIREDMDEESPARLASIRDAILAVTDRKFWEITDRGFNFDFVEPEMRKYVHEFFDPMVDGL
ncbi:MAG: hypothetical protein CMH57_11020 [Myxococcales bacterium]|nr:hypothetical protein [Myxococcales bacterium]